MIEHDDVIDTLRRARPEDLPGEVVSPHAPAALALLEEILTMQTIQPPVMDQDDVPAVRRPRSLVRPRSRRLLAVGAVAAATVAVVATASVVLSPAEPSEATTIETALARSSAALNVAGRAEVTWEQSYVNEDGTPRYSDSGVFIWAYSGDDSSTTIQQWAAAGVDPSDEVHEEHRWVDGEIYLFIDDADLDEREHGQFRWFRSSDDDVNNEQSQPDPATLLDVLQPAGDFEEVGTETIDGVETRRLQAVTPEETPPLPLGAYGNQMGEHSLGDVTDLEVWVDDNGIVRRIDVVVRAEFPASSLIEGEVPVTRTSSSSIRFHDIGEPITIEAPPDAGNLPEFP